MIELMKIEKKDVLGNDMDFLCQSIMQDVCRKCPKYRECYGSRQKETIGEIASILEQAYQCSGVDGRMASSEFRRNCVFFQPFMEEISWLYRLIFLRECRVNMQKGEEICGRKKMALKTLFFRKGIHFIKGKEYKDGSGLLQVTVQVQPLLGTKKAELVRKCLNTYYKRNFYRNMETTWLRPGENRISFIEENGFHVVFGQRCCNKKGEDVCGDTFSFTNFGRKRAVMLLSDGMGTGKKANEDSRRLIETLEDLLEAGISEEFALEMIQDALLFQDKGAFSTIDAAVISLKTGILKLLKAGGMATFIRHKNSVERIMPAALPPGCRIGQQFDLKYKKLYDGDMVEDGYDDDRTVLVAAIWEKGTQKCGINIGRE